MSFWTLRPSLRSEFMDDETASWEDFAAALEDLAVANRWLGGLTAATAEPLELARAAARAGARPVVIADLAAGGGDVALALSSACRAAGIDARILALDSSRHAARFACERSVADRCVVSLRGDIAAPPFAAGAVHVAHAGQFLHHVAPAERAAMLHHLLGIGTVGSVVSDLIRAHPARLGVAAFGRLTRRRRFFRHDAPLSVARGVSPAEALALASDCGWPDVRVTFRPFWRVTWSRGPHAPAAAG